MTLLDLLLVYFKRYHYWVAGILFLFSFLILTYPLIINFNSGISGFYNSDAPIFLWNAWEWGQKLILGQFNFFTTDIFYPLGASLTLHTNTQIQSLATATLNLFVKNWPLSFNLVYCFSVLLGGMLAYSFFRLWFKSFWPSFLAAHYFIFQHLWAVYNLFGTQNLLNWWYLPGALLFYELGWRKRRPIFYGLAGVVCALSFLNDFILFLIVGAVLTAYVLVRPWSGLARGYFIEGKHLFWSGLLALAGFFLGAGWKIYLLFSTATWWNTALPSLADVDFYHADFINLFRPVRFQAWWGNLNFAWRPVAISNGNAFLGFTFLLVLLLGILIYTKTRARRAGEKIWPWCAFGLGVLLLLAAGPYWHFFGYDTHIPLLTWVIAKLFPAFLNMRVPARWLFGAIFFVAGFLGIILEYININWPYRFSRRLLFFVLYIFLILDSFMWPKNILSATPQSLPLFSKIKTDTAGVVLELPLAITSGYFSLNEKGRINMLHQTVHEQPIVGGHVSRLPFSYEDWYKRAPILKYLLFYDTQAPDSSDLDVRQSALFFDYYQVKYVVLDKNLANFDSDKGIELKNYLISFLGFKFYYEDDNFLAFKK